MKKFKEWLIKDWWLKIVSLALSFILWFVWIQIENPTDTKEFANIKVTFTNTDSFDVDNKVYEVLDGSDVVKVVVTAPKSVINNISSADIIAEADVSKMANGQIPISYSLANASSYDKVVGSGETVNLSIEDRARKYVSLITFTEGEVAENHLFNGVVLDQNMIEISGPQSAVDKVNYAAVNINIDGAKESISANMEISLYDQSNKLVNLSTITKQSDSVHVSVEILETKLVTVYAGKVGIPADGYLYADDIDISPAQIQIAGLSRDLTGISRITISDPIDITDAEGNVTRDYDLTKYLPRNVIFANPDYDGSAIVTAKVEPKSARSFNISTGNIKLINVPQDVNMKVSPIADRIRVNIEGLQSDIDALSDDKITATIDVGAWMADNHITSFNQKSYQMPMTVNLTGSLEVNQIMTVNVVIE